MSIQDIFDAGRRFAIFLRKVVYPGIVDTSVFFYDFVDFIPAFCLVSLTSICWILSSWAAFFSRSSNCFNLLPASFKLILKLSAAALFLLMMYLLFAFLLIFIASFVSGFIRNL